METPTIEILDRHQTSQRAKSNRHIVLDEREILRRIRILAELMDNRFTLPGTTYRFGLDGLIGLIPGVGDLITTAMGGYIIYLARQLKVPNHVLARMVFNVMVDMSVGIVPVLGDVADLAWKANLKNVRILERHLQKLSR